METDIPVAEQRALKKIHLGRKWLCVVCTAHIASIYLFISMLDWNLVIRQRSEDEVIETGDGIWYVMVKAKAW